jgi:uncharacterized protein YlzI (FlbEa/FlbD family)
MKITIETTNGERHRISVESIDKTAKSGTGTKITMTNGKSYKVPETVTAVNRVIAVKKKWKRDHTFAA